MGAPNHDLASIRGMARAVAAAAVASFLALVTLRGLAEAGQAQGEGRPAADVTIRRDRAGQPAGLHVKAAGREFDLELERNLDLVVPDAKVVFVGGQRREQPLHASAWKGRVAGQADSDVRVTVDGQRVRGYVRNGDEVLVIEASDSTVEHTLANAAAVVGAAEPTGCDSDETMVAPETTLRSARAVVAPGGLKMLDLSVVVDAAFWNRHGAGTVEAVQALFNQVDGISRRDLGLAVQIRQVLVYTAAAAQPFATTGVQLGEILSRLSLARQADADGAMSAGDVTHLMIGSDLGGPVGLAWVGGVCHRSSGASVTEVTGSVDYLATIAATHEIGHTLGAWHDGQPGSECETTPKGQIMWPVLYATVQDGFSTCSTNTIQDHIAAAACLDDSIPAGCGDGVLDAGEECDDGNTTGGDCCRMNCTLDLPGMPCAGDDVACHDHVCDGLGACATRPNSDPCDTGDACSEGLCSDGACVPTGETSTFDAVDANFRVDDRGMLGAAKLVASAPLVEGASSPVDAGLRLKVQMGGATIYDQYLEAGVWTEKGNGIYTYRSASAVTGTIRKAKVVYSAASGTVTYRLQLAAPNQELAAETPEVFVLAGSQVDGQCSSGAPAACESLGSKYICE